MDLHFIPVILFLIFTNETLGYQQVVSVIPAGDLGQTLLSGQQLLTTQGVIQPPSSVIQLLRQPSVGGVTQIVGQPGLVTQVLGGQTGLSQGTQVVGQSGLVTQVLGGQTGISPGIQVLGGSGIGTLGTGLPVFTTLSSSGVNGLGLSTATNLPYPYTSGLSGIAGTTTTNLNGIPVILSGSTGVNLLNNGLQTSVLQQPTVVGVPSTTSAYAQQPFVGAVVRNVPQEEEAAQMDTASSERESAGPVHMEKYVWGRSALSNNEALDTEDIQKRKADLPIYFLQMPIPAATGGVVASPMLAVNRFAASPSPSPARVRNPFVGENGKRKKHFEHYEYYRNLDMTPKLFYMPISTIQPTATTSSNPPTPYPTE